MKKIIIASLIGMFVSCAPHIPVYTESSKNDVDVLVKIFDLNKDAVDYEGPVNFQKQIALNIAALLQKKGITAVIAPVSSTLNIEAKYEINGTVILVDPGSTALRIWLGMGPAKFKARATLIEKQSNEIVEEFKNDRSSGSWLSEEPILQKVCLEVSEDIIDNFIKKIEVIRE
jgi:hypothetical protein